MEYPKINSLWKRQGWYFDEKLKENTPHELQENRQSFIEGDYAAPEFGNIIRWHVEEKVDGTNIRIFYKDGKVTFGGRTKDSQLPCHLLTYLQSTFGDWNLPKVFPCIDNEKYPKVILFGEGYGPKIQKGGEKYRDDPGFILFDVVINGWWLKREDVQEIAHKLFIPMVPYIAIMTESIIVDYVKRKPKSLIHASYGCMEGVICRSEPLMLFRNGNPIMWKLKCKEFK
jgi:ATP-dependent RNA circularization protein (DNA/RNA ligase family)